MNFFQRVWDVENESNLELKFAKFGALWAEFDRLEIPAEFSPKSLETPSYARICEVKSITDFKKQKGAPKQVASLHALAHIEFSAIDIALDACYAFCAMPRQFYFDWLEVAGDEIRHFKLVNSLLEKTGHNYGDFAVHNGLFVALQNTRGDLVERMAILPRYMEANGLDANNFMLSKLDNIELAGVLKIIHDEEISHVKKGDFWFKFACERAGISPNCWFEIVKKHYPNAFKSVREIDERSRIQAGFSTNEIEKIKNFKED